MVTACSKFCTWALILVQWSPNCLRKGKLRHGMWGVEPYDVEDADGICKSLVRKGIVCLADIKFPLPYRAKSYSLVIVSDALDYLSPKYLNKMLPGFARVSTDGLVVFTGYPGQQRAKVAELSKFGQPVIWQKCKAHLGGYAFLSRPV